MPSFFDPYIGYTNSGLLLIGKNPTVNWEAIGFGEGGRPNIMGTLTINFCVSGDNNLPSTSGQSGAAAINMIASVGLAAGDLVNIVTGSTNAPKFFNFSFKEVAVCSGDGKGNSQEARMMILASQIYPAPPTSSDAPPTGG